MNLHQNKSRGTLYFIVLGIVSVLWLLLRVIPKPDRISYPCQRIAAANAVAFLSWLFGSAITAIFFKKAFRKIRESRFAPAIILLVLAFTLGAGTILLSFNQEIKAAVNEKENVVFTPDDLIQPVGDAKGIFPGRVTWAHDPKAVSYDPGSSEGNWWENRNTDPVRVKQMFDFSLMALTGANSTPEAWDKLFRDANLRKGLGDVGYTPGEKIAIKPNLVMGLSGNKERINFPGPTPQLMLAIVEELIDEVGVQGEDITIYDVSARIPDYIMLPLKYSREAQKIRFVGNPKWLEGTEANRYEAAQCNMEQEIHFADSTVSAMYWPNVVTEAAYLIHMPNLKPHHMAGVTLTAKNLYGSVFFPTATTEFWPVEDGNYLYGFGPNNKYDSLGTLDPHSGLHRCAAVHDYEDANVGFFPAREYGTFNYLVDMLGHPQIRDKSILYIMDAMYGCIRAGKIAKYESFGNQYTASLFLSQDVLALESVSLDFLRADAEASKQVYGNVDNYLHESALADQAPSGVVYNPGAEASPLQSLGVHEHWNNAEDKLYSRNLGTGEGIELYQVDHTVGIKPWDGSVQFGIELGQNYPNPFRSMTTITFELVNETKLTLIIYDHLGRKVETVADDLYPPGEQSVNWDASAFQNGVYFCQLRTRSGFNKTIELQKQ